MFFLNCWILTYHLIIATLLQENHQTRQRFCPVLVSLCELKLQLPILSWLEWHMVWSLGLQQQYAVILLLKTCAMVWGATFVLSGGFFELLLPSYQFILLWFLASTMHFHPEKLVRIFSLTILCKLWRWLCGKMTVDLQFHKCSVAAMRLIRHLH